MPPSTLTPAAAMMFYNASFHSLWPDNAGSRNRGEQQLPLIKD